jgi:hypothetical protein
MKKFSTFFPICFKFAKKADGIEIAHRNCLG